MRKYNRPFHKKEFIEIDKKIRYISWVYYEYYISEESEMLNTDYGHYLDELNSDVMWWYQKKYLPKLERSIKFSKILGDEDYIKNIGWKVLN